MADSSPFRGSLQWSSPARGSQLWSSPARTVLSDILSEGEDRNSERKHAESIEKARLGADRLREACEKIALIEYIKEQQILIAGDERREQERIAQETKLAEERSRLLELRKKKVEIPTSPPPEPEPKNLASPAAPPSSTPVNSPNGVTSGAPGSISSAPAAANSPFSARPQAPSPLGNSSQPGPSKPSFAIQPQANGVIHTQPQPSTSQPPAGVSAQVGLDRYAEIHNNLKMLRASMNDQMISNAALTSRMGDMRREIKKCCGQLRQGAGSNRKQVGSVC